MGKFLMKALMDRRTVDMPFCKPAYKLILQLPITLDDIEEIDTALYRSLKWTLENDITDILFETFSVTIKLDSGEEKVIELCEGGAEIEVTEENKADYISLMTKWRGGDTGTSIELSAFYEGMEHILSQPTFLDLTVEELELMLNGRPELDVNDLRAYTIYQGNFHDEHHLVYWLWQAVESFDSSTRDKFLRFITGTTKMPLDGFDPPINITEGADMEPTALPRAHTCFNQIVLPPYKSYETVVEKLKYAIENAEGFALT